MRGCDGFRASSAARAGNGLPRIEPGMPDPAGTGLSRRGLLLRGSALALSVYGAHRLGPAALQEGVARAAAAAPGRVLLVAYLPGGVDGLSVLAPTGDRRYRRLRPTLAVAGGTPHATDPGLRWSPAAAGLATLDREGKVLAAPAIGYRDADQSHFTSRHFWEVGATDPHLRTGWLGRYLDRHGSADNVLQGLSLGGTLSPALATTSSPVAAVADPFAVGLRLPGVEDADRPSVHAALRAMGELPGGDAAHVAARTALRDAARVRDSLAPLRALPAVIPYPDTEYGRRLSALPALLASGAPVRCVTIDAPGSYDTHARQATTLAPALRETCDGLLALQRDLEARGLADRVLTLVWSEFGRRPRENGGGTDHGAAGVGFLVGSRVQGGLLGEFPGLARLDDDDNLRVTTDFRGVYRGVLEQWLGVDATPLVPRGGGRDVPRLLRS
jgi:uncharacterized protein (DUF1501 family)